MSTAGNMRVTRSGSRARSTGAASTAAPSVAASSRARSRRSRAAAPLPEDDKPAVGNQVTRAYGTEGKSAQAQLLSAQIGMNQAINPIANAVARAQAPETPVANTSDRLPPLDEAPEEREEMPEDREEPPFRFDRRPPSVESYVGQPLPQQSFLSRLFWGPRRDGFNPEGPDRTSNNIVADSIRGRFNGPRREDFRETSWSWSLFLNHAMLTLALLVLIILIYERSRTYLFGFGSESELSKKANVSSPLVSFLQKRVAKIEQHVQELSLNSESADDHQINWFTPGFGAGIDLYLSSPTLSKCDPTWTPAGWPWSMFKSQACPEISLSEPHFAALSAWIDPVDDSWCAPPSDGKLQLTVVLPRTITPTELVVEHAAKDEMPVGFMSSSPREVELWIHVPDDATRKALLQAINHVNPSLLEDSSPQGKTLGARQALPFDYVPVGRWQYDIYANKALQTFPLSLPLSHYGVGTDKVAVRVNSNWGSAKFTCLSRLRLYGDDVSGITEDLDPLA